MQGGKNLWGGGEAAAPSNLHLLLRAWNLNVYQQNMVFSHYFKRFFWDLFREREMFRKFRFFFNIFIVGTDSTIHKATLEDWGGDI